MEATHSKDATSQEKMEEASLKGPVQKKKEWLENAFKKRGPLRKRVHVPSHDLINDRLKWIEDKQKAVSDSSGKDVGNSLIEGRRKWLKEKQKRQQQQSEIAKNDISPSTGETKKKADLSSTCATKEDSQFPNLATCLPAEERNDLDQGQESNPCDNPQRLKMSCSSDAGSTSFPSREAPNTNESTVTSNATAQSVESPTAARDEAPFASSSARLGEHTGSQKAAPSAMSENKSKPARTMRHGRSIAFTRALQTRVSKPTDEDEVGEIPQFNVVASSQKKQPKQESQQQRDLKIAPSNANPTEDFLAETRSSESIGDSPHLKEQGNGVKLTLTGKAKRPQVCKISQSMMETHCSDIVASVENSVESSRIVVESDCTLGTGDKDNEVAASCGSREEKAEAVSADCVDLNDEALASSATVKKNAEEVASGFTRELQKEDCDFSGRDRATEGVVVVVVDDDDEPMEGSSGFPDSVIKPEVFADVAEGDQLVAAVVSGISTSAKFSVMDKADANADTDAMVFEAGPHAEGEVVIASNFHHSEKPHEVTTVVAQNEKIDESTTLSHGGMAAASLPGVASCPKYGAAKFQEDKIHPNVLAPDDVVDEKVDDIDSDLGQRYEIEAVDDKVSVTERQRKYVVPVVSRSGSLGNAKEDDEISEMVNTISVRDTDTRVPELKIAEHKDLMNHVDKSVPRVASFEATVASVPASDKCRQKYDAFPGNAAVHDQISEKGSTIVVSDTNTSVPEHESSEQTDQTNGVDKTVPRAASFEATGASVPADGKHTKTCDIIPSAKIDRRSYSKPSTSYENTFGFVSCGGQWKTIGTTPSRGSPVEDAQQDSNPGVVAEDVTSSEKAAKNATGTAQNEKEKALEAATIGHPHHGKIDDVSLESSECDSAKDETTESVMATVVLQVANTGGEPGIAAKTLSAETEDELVEINEAHYDEPVQSSSSGSSGASSSFSKNSEEMGASEKLKRKVIIAPSALLRNETDDEEKEEDLDKELSKLEPTRQCSEEKKDELGVEQVKKSRDKFPGEKSHLDKKKAVPSLSISYSSEKDSNKADVCVDATNSSHATNSFQATNSSTDAVDCPIGIEDAAVALDTNSSQLTSNINRSDSTDNDVQLQARCLENCSIL